MESTFSFRTSAKGHDCGYRGSLLPLSLLNYLQDAAYGHATALGVSVYDLFGRGLTWVLTRYHVAVDRYPRAGERFEVLTWASGRLRRYYLREFEIRGAKGDLIAKATSAWLVMDLKTRRPVDSLGRGSEFPTLEKRALPDDFPPLSTTGRDGEPHRFSVRLSEVDLNRHVNHVHYVQWALESVPLEVFERLSPVEVEAAYLGEARYGDTAMVHTVPSGGEGRYIHSISRESDGTPLAVIRVRWART